MAAADTTPVSAWSAGQEGGAVVSIVVAEDQRLVRAGIVMLLGAEDDLEVVGEAADGREAVDLARSRDADLVLMDVRMPGMDGVAATRLLTADHADPDKVVRVLMLTTFDDDDAVYGALRAGASGFLLKHAAPQDLITAVRRVVAGEAWIDPAVAGKVIAALARQPGPGVASPELLARLTPREREVLALMANGLSNREITERLVLSEATVKTHVARVLMKTGSRDRAQAVVLAYQTGLVTPPSVRRH
jgi:DNA-binding NarL/FixJ family response regulator